MRRIRNPSPLAGPRDRDGPRLTLNMEALRRYQMPTQNELIDVRVLRDVREGAEAMTSDGKRLGKIDGVEGRYIKINAPFARDYWLSAEYVTEETPSCVRFGFEKKDLGAYRVAKPVVAADPLVDQQDAVLSMREQMEQRQRMEQELREQRRRAG
jgi:hypothetical protein